MIRDRDKKYGDVFTGRVVALKIGHILISSRSAWQDPHAERVIGSVRRHCLDHTIVFNERHLHRVLTEYMDYYNKYRTHLGLGKDNPKPRAIEHTDSSSIKSEPMAGDLHYRYYRQAA
jgi:hypothetical protein